MRVGHLVQHGDAGGALGDQVFEGRGLERLGLDGDALMHGAGGQALVQLLAGDDLGLQPAQGQALGGVLGGEELQELPVGVRQGRLNGMRAPEPDRAAFLFALRPGRTGRGRAGTGRAGRPVSGPFCMVARHEVHPYKAASGVDLGFVKALLKRRRGGVKRRWRGSCGGMGEWLNPSDCKSDRLAYAGSNPAPSTTPPAPPARQLP